jgi:hypothetical protein
VSELTFSSEDLEQARAALSTLREDISNYVNSSGVLPATGSQALREQEVFSRRESVRTAYSQAIVLLEVAGDQLAAIVKMFEAPVDTIAPWTNVRALLEASALAVWILDPGIDVATRVQRSIALRYEGLLEQRKFFRAAGHDVERLTKRLGELEELALTLGYPPVVDRKGKRIGAGIKVPPATELAEASLGEGGMYRLLSAVAHGHFWAIQQLSFELLPEDPVAAHAAGYRAMTKVLKPAGLIYLSLGAATAFGRACWNLSRYSGWDRDKISTILATAFDTLQASEKARFWTVPDDGSAA